MNDRIIILSLINLLILNFCLSQHICSDGQPGLAQCQGNPPICTDTRALGCELGQNNGRWYCCAAYCDDAVPTRVALGTQNGRCRNGICPSDPSRICKRMSDGIEYCCPPAVPGPGGSNGTGCTDVANNCEQRADLCIIEYAYDQMVRECPKTCNVCPGTCDDLGTDCPDRQRAGYCEKTLYNDLMNWQCPKSPELLELASLRKFDIYPFNSLGGRKVCQVQFNHQSAGKVR
uniref:ShKT domain-containing protein n=1 Tax=Globodera rostochiensis TaxID=31243 RepID=A0A914I0I0_GLORO